MDKLDAIRKGSHKNGHYYFRLSKEVEDRIEKINKNKYVETEKYRIIEIYDKIICRSFSR